MNTELPKFPCSAPKEAHSQTLRAGHVTVETRTPIRSSRALDRATSARLMLQAALEISLTRNLNLFLLIEGAPGLRRRSLMRQYNLLLLQDVDYGIYGRGGVTFKF